MPDCLLGTVVAADCDGDLDLYPPVFITADTMHMSRSASPLPMIDPSLLLRPIACASPASPLGTMLTVVSPRHLHRVSANASPSVNSWTGGEASHHNHYYQHQQQQHHPRHSHHHLALHSGPILLSEPNMVMATQRLGTDNQAVTNARGVVFNNNGAPPPPPPMAFAPDRHHQQLLHNDDGGGGGGGFRKFSLGQSSAPASVSISSERSQVTGNKVLHIKKNNEKREYKDEAEDTSSHEHFLDNPNIDELFLLGSVSQQSLVGKRLPQQPTHPLTLYICLRFRSTKTARAPFLPHLSLCLCLSLDC